MEQSPITYKQMQDSKQLQDVFPVVGVISHAVFLILEALAIIALQFVLLLNNASMAFLSGGMWGGFLLLITEIFTFVALSRKSRSMIVASVTLHVISAVFMLVGCTMIGGIAMAGGPCPVSSSPFYSCNYSVIEASYISQLCISGLAMIQSVFFAVYVMNKLSKISSVNFVA